MLGLDLLLSYALMGILFLRQVSIFKQQNKINYAPLMLSIGALFAIIHLMLYATDAHLVTALKESLSVTVIALSLFLVMNVLHQAQTNAYNQLQRDSSALMNEQITQMKGYIAMLEAKSASMHDEEQESLFAIYEQIKKDINSLSKIQNNQENFTEQFETLIAQQKKVIKSVDNFTNVQIPQLDEVMHSHIDMLRVSEQDHYNRLKKAFEGADAVKCDIKEEMDEVLEDIKSMKGMAGELSASISQKVLLELTTVTTDFEKQLNHLRAQSESVATSLSEGENILSGVRKQSEMLMKQIVLSSNNMKSLEEHSRDLANLYTPLKAVVQDIEMIRNDYKIAYGELTNLVNEFNNIEKEQIDAMKKRVNELSEGLIDKIDASLEKLHTHYHIASSEVTNTVSELAKKAKVQHSYKFEE